MVVRTMAKEQETTSLDTSSSLGEGHRRDGSTIFPNNKDEAEEPVESDGKDAGAAVVSPTSISMETTRLFAVQALALTVQEWSSMGQGEDPSVSEAALFDSENAMEVCVHRVTALLLVRIVAIKFFATDNHSDISTSGICRQALIADEPPWPCITIPVLEQLQRYVKTMLQNYSATLPFHNFQHAVTVVVNCNKLLDLMLAENHETAQLDERCPPTFGLRYNPWLLAALLFAALIHDAQHEGVTNAQLVMENHPAALLYNDQSVQEKRALQVAFTEFLKPDYAALRHEMFGADNVEYHEFRLAIVCAVMSTDLASPDQTVMTKSKWKEAFGQQQQQLLQNQGRRRSLASNISMPKASRFFNRRGSNASDISDVTTDMHWQGRPTSPIDSPRFQSDVEISPHRRLSCDNNARRRLSGDDGNHNRNRRMSGDSNYGRYGRRRRMSADGSPSHRHRPPEATAESSDVAVDSAAVLLASKTVPRGSTNGHHRGQSLESSVESDDFVADSVAMYMASKTVPLIRALALSGEVSDGSIISDAVDSFARNKEHLKQRSGKTVDTEKAERSDDASVSSIVSDALDSVVRRKQQEEQQSRTPASDRLSENDKSARSDDVSGSIVSDALDAFAQGRDKQKIKQRSRSVEFAENEKELGSDGASKMKNESKTPFRRRVTKTQSAGTLGSGETSFASFAAESIKMNQKRLHGAHLTRRRANKPTEGILVIDTSKYTGNDPSLPLRYQPDSAKGRDGIDVNVNRGNLDYEESSFSLTPPSSDDEYEKPTVPAVVSQPFEGQTQVAEEPFPSTDDLESPRRFKHESRRASTGMVSSRFGSLVDQRIDEDHPNTGSFRNLRSKSMDLGLNPTAPNSESRRFRKRLGIRRSMDLSGEAIEIYSKRSSVGGISALSSPQADDAFEYDEPDYLRASVVLDAMLRAADVGHFLQSWENMTNWSSKMYLELSKAHREGSGYDLGADWFDNQIRIMESYLKPLALQLDDAGVFGEFTGAMFAQSVDEIRDHWLVYGYEFTEKMREEAKKALPEGV